MNRNLNDIIPPSRRRAQVGEAETPSYTPPPMPVDAPMDHSSYGRPVQLRSSRKFPFGTALIALVVVAASVGALFIFSGAEVTITPSVNASMVSGEFIATASGGDLPFEIIAAEQLGSASVPSEGTETVSTAAQGTITIMNKQDVPQQLIKNTRFQTASGLVFRIHDSVTVPAAKGGNPGTVDVTAYADVAGEQYNVGASTFTLPGLAGGKTFDLVTAASKEAMKGGFNGPRPSVSAATRETAATGVRSKLAPQIEEALLAKVPEGYVLLPGSSRVVYESQPDQAAATGNVEISERASATAVVFPSQALARAIAYQVVGEYSGQTVSLGDYSGLTLTPVADMPASGAQEFAFSLAGNTTIVWEVDTAKIAGAVAGKTRESARVLVSGFPEVDQAVLVLRPFWTGSFPQDPAKITVTVKGQASSK